MLDHSVYPDVCPAPDELSTLADRADYVHRICSAFDFGVFPERADWERFASWQDVFDTFPLPHSPAYHTFRARYGWPAVPRGTSGLMPGWRAQDLREGRIDPCESTV
jgi:hypothetical protein